MPSLRAQHLEHLGSHLKVDREAGGLIREDESGQGLVPLVVLCPYVHGVPRVHCLL